MAASTHSIWNGMLTSHAATEIGVAAGLPTARDKARAAAHTSADMIEPSYAFCKSGGQAEGTFGNKAKTSPGVHPMESNLGLDFESLSIPTWNEFSLSVNAQLPDHQNDLAVDSINLLRNMGLAGDNYDVPFSSDPPAPMTGYTDFMPLPLDMWTTSPAFETALPPPNNFQPIAPAPEPRHNVSRPQNIAATRIRCTANGCTKTFRRPGDYRRHMTKHQDPTLDCAVRGCHKVFYRLDKLRDHMRKGHKINL